MKRLLLCISLIFLSTILKSADLEVGGLTGKESIDFMSGLTESIKKLIKEKPSEYLNKINDLINNAKSNLDEDNFQLFLQRLLNLTFQNDLDLDFVKILVEYNVKILPSHLNTLYYSQVPQSERFDHVLPKVESKDNSEFSRGSNTNFALRKSASCPAGFLSSSERQDLIKIKLQLMALFDLLLPYIETFKYDDAAVQRWINDMIKETRERKMHSILEGSIEQE